MNYPCARSIHAHGAQRDPNLSGSLLNWGYGHDREKDVTGQVNQSKISKDIV